MFVLSFVFSLNFRIHYLEEQLRDMELQADDRRKQEEKRFKEAVSRHEREKSYECEQYISRAYTLQQELLEARDETRRTMSLADRRLQEKQKLEEQLQAKTEATEEQQAELNRLKDLSRRHRDEEIANQRVMDVLTQELDELRQRDFGTSSQRNNFSATSERYSKLVAELKQELKGVKLENQELKEQAEELRGELLTTRLEEGRSLLNQQATSLAEEMGSLNEEQVSTFVLFDKLFLNCLLTLLFPLMLPITQFCLVVSYIVI